MKEKKFKLVLEHLGRQAFPDDIDPWAAFQNAQVKLMLHNQPSRNRNTRLALGATAVLLILVTILVATPPGQAFADAVIQLFRPAAASSFPVSGTPFEPTQPPTYVPQLKPAAISEPAESIPTAEPYDPQPQDQACAEADNALAPHCQVLRAEEKVGFDALEFPGDPKGLVFSKVDILPANQAISIQYDAIGGGGQLTLLQSEINLSVSVWGDVPGDAVVQVQVGGTQGEFVHGMFTVHPNQTQATWDPETCVWRLRWRQGGKLFQLEKIGNVEPIEYITQAVMIQMAESLVKSPAIINPIRTEYLTSIAQAEEVVPFDILEPAVLPEGFTFDYASWDADLSQLQLIYDLPGESWGARLLIIETVLEKAGVEMTEGTKVTVNGYPGHLNLDSSGITLAWRTDKHDIMLSLSGNLSGAQFTREQILEIAQSMQ